ncbi:MAG: DUF2812 domain-containing protein [Lachnospiraceae bacterium]|nr:DUF2812 domain-containing protein [Lachnospiraceae bacterium]
MGVQRSMFAALKHVVPSDLEYYLEEKNSDGLKLLPLGQGSLFSLLFSEEKPEKLMYVVDCPTLPKALYMQKLTDEGWEYMGQSLNSYVWRKRYEDTNRPRNFADKVGIKSHCLKLGLITLLLTLVFAGLFCALCFSLYREYQLQPPEATRFVVYLLVIAVQLPFVFCFGSMSAKLLKENRRL